MSERGIMDWLCSIWRMWAAIVSVVLLFGIAHAHAQDCIYCPIGGRVVDGENQKVIPEAVCELYEGANLAGSQKSDLQGKFYFNLSAPSAVDSLSVNIKINGYDPYYVTLYNLNSPVDLGDCLMFKAATDLEGVVVEGRPVIQRGGKMIITPLESQLKTSMNALELLGNLSIPGLWYSHAERAISIANKIPVIFVNGVQSTQQQLLSIKPSDVAGVEYSNSVPLIYSSMGDCMINVRLKKRQEGGSVMLSEYNDFQGLRVTPNADATYNSGPSRFRTNFGFTLERRDKVYDTEYTRYLDPKMNAETKGNSVSPFNNKYYSALVEYIYNPSQSLIFMVRGSFNADVSLRKEFNDIDDSLLGSYSFYDRIHWKNRNPSIDLYFSKSFRGKSVLDINVVGNYKDHDYMDFMEYSGYPGATTEMYSVGSKRYALLTAASYKYLLTPGINIALMYNNTLSHSRNSYPSTGNSTTMNENNNRVMLAYEQSAGPVWLQLKGGFTQSHLSEGGRSNDNTGYRIDLNANWNISPYWDLSLKSFFSPTTLPFNTLEENPMAISNYEYITGNPNLKEPQKIYMLLTTPFSYNKFRGNASVLYIEAFHPLLTRTSFIPEEQKFRTVYVNGKNNYLVQCAVEAGYYGLLNMFNLRGRIQYYKGGVAIDGWRRAYDNVSGRIVLDWYYRNWYVSYSYSFPQKTIDGYVYRQDFSNNALTVGYRPDGHWSFQLNWLNMFSKHGSRYEQLTISPDKEYYLSRHMKEDGNMISMYVTYNFSFGELFQSKRKKNLNLEDTQSIFKTR